MMGISKFAYIIFLAHPQKEIEQHKIEVKCIYNAGYS